MKSVLVFTRLSRSRGCVGFDAMRISPKPTSVPGRLSPEFLPFGIFQLP